MKITYKNFINSSRISEYPIYLIIGNPYHLQNEVQFRLESYFKNKEYTVKKYIVDSDFNIEFLKDDLENYSLFSDNKLILLNIISNTIPKNIASYLTDMEPVSDSVIILKLSAQSPSFKKTKIYSKIESQGCIVEVYELNGANLNDWVKKKFAKNNIIYNEDLFKKLIDKNEGNTSAISQELYKMSLLDIKDVGVYFNYLQKEYKFTEFDLTDSIIDGDLPKTLKILSYLKSIKSPDVYILFLINNEIKKVYSLSNNLTPQPYVPSFKKNAYSKFSRDYSNQHLIDLMQYCYSIDKLIKLGSSQNHIWHNLEVVVTSFVLKKPLPYQTKTEIA